jgi:alpha-1,6-mannosyltransferase
MYFSSYLPKLLLGSLPLSMLGSIMDPRIRSLLLPAVVSVLLMSCLAHKEWRFTVYIIPLFNVAAAQGANQL